ncbi:hypothetical protein BBP40_004714 [Aspergillus hancockii]|nr:hypothetical protein BBP40_004714 [Aspergillus hancockii]
MSERRYTRSHHLPSPFSVSVLYSVPTKTAMLFRVCELNRTQASLQQSSQQFRLCTHHSNQPRAQISCVFAYGHEGATNCEGKKLRTTIRHAAASLDKWLVRIGFEHMESAAGDEKRKPWVGQVDTYYQTVLHLVVWHLCRDREGSSNTVLVWANKYKVGFPLHVACDRKSFDLEMRRVRAQCQPEADSLSWRKILLDDDVWKR